jgi:hypothetical protein
MCAFARRTDYTGISATIKSYLNAFAMAIMRRIYRDTSTMVLCLHRGMLRKEQEHWGWEDGCFDTLKRVSRIVTNNDDTILNLLPVLRVLRVSLMCDTRFPGKQH